MAVVTFAVQERPGRISSGGLFSADHHFEIFGFLAGDGALRRGQAGGAEDRGIADFDDVALESSVRVWHRW